MENLTFANRSVITIAKDEWNLKKKPTKFSLVDLCSIELLFIDLWFPFDGWPMRPTPTSDFLVIPYDAQKWELIRFWMALISLADFDRFNNKIDMRDEKCIFNFPSTRKKEEKIRIPL